MQSLRSTEAWFGDRAAERAVRMNAMGGHLEFHSAPGEGTRAILVLPLLTESAQALAQQPAKVSMPKAFAHPNNSRLGQNRCRVLIADDHAMVRQGLRSMLEGFPNIEVIGEASNGEEAVEMDSQLHPDIFVMDVTMPKLDGIEATRRIKRQNPSTIVIGLSVQDSPHVETEMRTAGAAAFLNKEIAADQLYETIKAVQHQRY